MEEKESTISGSPCGSDSYSDSPPPVSSNLSFPQPPPPPPPPQQAMSMVPVERNVDFSSAASAATATATTTAVMTPRGNSGGTVDLFGKKKRGRPRKYDADGNLRVPQSHSSVVSTSPPSSGFSLSPSPEFSSSKRSRGGRAAASGSWQLLASLGELFASTAGADFTPHIVTVNTGEDVAGKIISFAQKGLRGICVLSANGAVSNVTIRQPGSSGGILTYEGRFEILSLSGSFTILDSGGVRRTGGLSVSLAGPDGRVVGGGVAGVLLAASPIQIVVGSFMPNSGKVQKRKYNRQHSTPSLTSPDATDTVAAAKITSQTKPDSENNFTPITPSPVQGHQADTSNNDTNKQLPNAPNVMSSNFAAGWNGSNMMISGQRPSPDINVSLPSE